MACLVESGRADMGSFPFESGVGVFEPAQQALIAWNGGEEIMVLGKDQDAHAGCPCFRWRDLRHRREHPASAWEARLGLVAVLGDHGLTRQV